MRGARCHDVRHCVFATTHTLPALAFLVPAQHSMVPVTFGAGASRLTIAARRR
jgi:hypothetical protein